MKARNVNIGRRWFEQMWSEPNLDIADELVDEQYHPDWVQIEAIGPAQVKHEIRYFRSVFPDLKYEIREICGEDDKVWIRYKGRGTHTGNAWGFEPTNKAVEFEGATILYINAEGKIIDQWAAYSFYDIFADLGLVPPWWELSKLFEK
ncbi:MAG: ester cyclase [Candidatus Hodarchaeales archaeon]|jgi:predicted ester cyclase